MLDTLVQNPEAVLVLASSLDGILVCESSADMAPVAVSQDTPRTLRILDSKVVFLTMADQQPIFLTMPAAQGEPGVEGPLGPGAVGLSQIVSSAGDVYPVANTFVGIDKTVPELTAVYLPQDANDGDMVVVKDMSGNASTFPITVFGLPSIDKKPSYLIAVDHSGITFHRNKVEWSIL